jgi:hypothetical protein
MKKGIMNLFSLAFFAVLSISAQEPFGSIQGTVKDAQGAIVQNATVTVRSVATNASRTANTDADGQYRVLQLQPGVYEVKATAQGFKQSVLGNIQVQVGQTAAVDLSLQVGDVGEVVNVTPESEVQIERSDNSVSGVVNTLQIESLPLNGRNFLDLAQLQPGTEKVDGGSFDPTKANFTGVSVGGQAGRSTQITVDGGSVVDNVVGTTVQNFSQEIVQEFQIGLSNYSLSTGASASGSVNIVSRSGSNKFRGNAFIFARDDAFAAFPALGRLDVGSGIPSAAQTDRIPFDREQFGGTFSGPIVKDRLFFFGSYEQNIQDGSAIFNPLGAPRFAGFGSNPFREKLFTGKLDWTVNDQTAVFFRYSFNDNSATGPFPVGSGIAPRPDDGSLFLSNDEHVTNKSNNFVAGLTNALGSNVSNNFVANYLDFRNHIDPVTQGLPEIRLLPEQDFRSGTNSAAPQATFQKRFQLRDDLTFVQGSHTFNLGGNYERTDIAGLFQFARPALIRLFSTDAEGNRLPFNTEDDFLNASVRDIFMGIGDPNLPFNNNGKNTINDRIQLYAGDAWRLTPRITFNFGIAYRYDSNLWNSDLQRPAIIAPLFTNGTAAPRPDRNNWAPRIGFAWDPVGDGTTIVRGGFGVYYDNAIDNLRIFERADLGPVGAEQLLGRDSIISPVLGPFGGDALFNQGEITLSQALAILPALRSDLESRLTECDLPTTVECTQSVSGPIFSSNFQLPYSLQYSIGVQRELPWNMFLQVDFNYRKGLHEVIVYDANQASSVGGVRLTNFAAPVPVVDSAAFSTYSGLLARLDRRFKHGFQLTASYALSSFKAFNNDSLGLGGVPTNLNNLRADFGPAGLDRRHRLVVSAIWELPFFKNDTSVWKKNVLGNWNLSLISTTFSGVPESVFLPGNLDLSATGTFATYLPSTGPGSIGRSIKSVDELNGLIRAFNQNINTLGNTFRCGDLSPTGQCDLQGLPVLRLAELPSDTQLGGDSLISQDLRLTKTIAFSERYRLQLIGEVFNLFNVANLVNVNDLVLAAEGTPADQITTLRPTQRSNSIFGTGGPRAFQFGARFNF